MYKNVLIRTSKKKKKTDARKNGQKLNQDTSKNEREAEIIKEKDSKRNRMGMLVAANNLKTEYGMGKNSSLIYMNNEKKGKMSDAGIQKFLAEKKSLQF